MNLDSRYDEDLPEEVRELIAAVELEIGKLDAKAGRDVARIRQKAERDAAAVESKKDAATQQLRQELSERLKPVQIAYAKEGKLDEALAIRAQVRSMRLGGAHVEPAPERLSCQAEDVGKTFLYDTIGSVRGPVWGTDVYTADSSLAAAAVHAGVLKKGERGIVKVTVLDTRGREGFEGSRRNGVSTEDWDEWDYGFEVSRP
jgi:hypothetical protein